MPHALVIDDNSDRVEAYAAILQPDLPVQAVDSVADAVSYFLSHREDLPAVVCLDSRFYDAGYRDEMAGARVAAWIRRNRQDVSPMPAFVLGSIDDEANAVMRRILRSCKARVMEMPMAWCVPEELRRFARLTGAPVSA